MKTTNEAMPHFIGLAERNGSEWRKVGLFGIIILIERAVVGGKRDQLRNFKSVQVDKLWQAHFPVGILHSTC